jgi:hypothetical protein
MKYALTITKTAILCGNNNPSTFDIKLFDDKKEAVTQALSLYTAESSNLATDICMPCSSFNTDIDNNCLVEARIFGETEVIVIGVKFVKQ